MAQDLTQGGCECPICHGLKFITVNTVPLTVKPCDCVIKECIDRRMRKSGLSKKLESCTFDSFITGEEWQRTLKTKAKSYLEKLSSAGASKPWLFIGGNPGCGKTHLCTAICGGAMEAGANVKYMQWLTDIHKIKAAVNDEKYMPLLLPYLTADLLYIDDLFKGAGNKKSNPSEADVKICFELLNGRYNRDLPTIISSEYFLDAELVEVDQGTFSRVIEKTGLDFLISVERSPERNFRLKGVRGI